ncbi:WD-REPEATS-REGION domain-containing protein [Mycena venus]|uniref:WD-REPEATS-REGION domain-containing protein n=1 Tax=Mycena venus TaxID=2733690 RepID=A0A8H6XS93_9AGAR|nr:WD-REPEATS-REGION domain-containing protein [Mycena venus]
MVSHITLQTEGPTNAVDAVDDRAARLPDNPPDDRYQVAGAAGDADTEVRCDGLLQHISIELWEQHRSTPLSTSNSSRGSWSSLFNAGSVRQFMSGMQDSLKDGLTTPSEPPTTSTIPVPKVDCISRGPDSPLPRRRAYWRESGLPSPSSVSKSWNEATSPAVKHAVSFSSAGHRRPVVSQTNTRKDAIHEARVVLLDLPAGDKLDAFPAEKITEFMNHVYIYADVLFSWQLFHKRLELLKSVNYTDTAANSEQHGIGMIRPPARVQYGSAAPTHTPPAYTSGVMMAHKRIDAILPKPLKPGERPPPLKAVPGWTDGSQAWRMSTYSFAPPPKTHADVLDPSRKAYETCVASPHCSAQSGVSASSSSAGALSPSGGYSSALTSPISVNTASSSSLNSELLSSFEDSFARHTSSRLSLASSPSSSYTSSA